MVGRKPADSSGETMINNIVCFNITIKSKNERNFEEKEYISCDKT